MNSWIFQGNPQHFDINSYISEGKVISWGVRQARYTSEIKIDDKVYIWRSNGKQPGGIVAHGKIIKEPYPNGDYDSVDIEIEDYRLTKEDGMLLREDLKNDIITSNLIIIKQPTGTNYKLTEEQATYIEKLWNNEICYKFKSHNIEEKYFYEFKSIANEWFEKYKDSIEDDYEFFKQFKSKEFLENIKWEDIQELGNHINAFNSLPLAKGRALGKQNHHIEHYAKSFKYLIYGEDELKERIDKFNFDEDYKLFGFGDAVISELLGNLYPDKLCFYNIRDKFALEDVFKINIEKSRGDTFGDRFIKFNKAIKDNNIDDLYLEIVGKKTKLPLNYEIDQFFSYLYETYKDRLIDNRKELVNDEESRYINYSKEEILKEVFIEEDKIDSILFNLDYKKNIILQGPPGVGKTFVAKKLCYLHQGRKCDDQIEMVQFHQSYSYEDFIRGYKPNKVGGFTLKDGLFYKFTQKAINDSDNNYYFIIDEINRGNLSKVFGELMMLIEKDKRGKEYQVSLAYQEDDEKFYIPKNLYIIGTMNTADRSLAVVDYALRRRFAFIDIEPAFNNKILKEYFIQYLGEKMSNKIINKITSLNKVIENDSLDLGKGYRIGHSYFTPTEKINDVENWYKRIIKMEIEPLIREYWFDKREEELLQKVDDLLED